MTPDWEQEFVDLLPLESRPSFNMLVHHLLGSLIAIAGTTQLLSMELSRPEVETLANIETMKSFTNDILKSSERAALFLTELRTEVREHSNKE